MQFGLKNLKPQVSKKKYKLPKGLNSRRMDLKPDTLSTRLWSELSAVSKTLLIKWNVVSPRGQPFCDDVSYYLNSLFASNLSSIYYNAHFIAKFHLPSFIHITFWIALSYSLDFSVCIVETARCKLWTSNGDVLFWCVYGDFVAIVAIIRAH